MAWVDYRYMLPHRLYSVLRIKPRVSSVLSKYSTIRAMSLHHFYTLNSSMLGGKLHLGEVVSFNSGKDPGLALSPASSVQSSLCWLSEGASEYGLDSFFSVQSGWNDVCDVFSLHFPKWLVSYTGTNERLWYVLGFCCCYFYCLFCF